MGGSISSYFTGVGGGLVMSMIAFSIVFIVIVGLMLVMMGMKYICKAIDSAGKKETPATNAQAKAPAAQAVVPAPAPKATAAAAEDDGELLAVISAAIMAACGSTAKVVSFAPAGGVRIPAATSWKSVGRLQNLEGF